MALASSSRLGRCDVTSDWVPDGADLACAFVRSRTGVEEEVSLRQPRRRRQRSAEPGEWSGAGPGPRDPVEAGRVLDDIVGSGGWADSLAVHSVTGRWPEIVGEAVAEHTEVVSFRDGVVVISCDSTAWATQMRILVPALLERLATEIGTGVVTSVEVKGPNAPSWVRGPRRVKGRGPRDTYG